MKNVAIIQARMSSSRLPNKVLADLGGMPAMAWTIRAARAVPGIDSVVLATSTGVDDDPISVWCTDNDVVCYRGPLDDVLERFCIAAKGEKADVVMRLTADCPFLDPIVCGEILMLREQAGADFAANVEPRSWPDGLDCEVFTAKALFEAGEEAKLPVEREHVTPFLWRHRDRYQHVNLPCPVPLKHELWTLDNPEDLEFLREVAARIDVSCPPSYLNIVRLLDNEPHLRTINQHAKRTSFGAGADIAGHGHERSNVFFERAQKVIPLASQTFSKSHLQYPKGVSPLFVSKGQGGRCWDVDGNEYVDLVGGLLPIVLGYCDPDVDQAIHRQLDSGITFSMPTRLEMELAERLVDIVPCAEKVRFGKNGSDVTAAAIRLARAYTGRQRVAVCGYHGWQDWYIGSTSRDKGVPGAVKDLTHVFAYNDLASLENVLQSNDGEFAAVMMEPMNIASPDEGYLEGVKALAHKHGALLVFDEIITGFRFALGGAQELLGVTPDLACLGKAMGNGMPISAVVGRADVMDEMTEIFFSGTFGGEALSLAAAIAVIDKMRNEPVIQHLWDSGTILKDGVGDLIKRMGLEDVVMQGGLAPWAFTIFKDHECASSAAIKTFWQRGMVRGGVLSVGTHNVCYAHSPVDIEHTLIVYERVFDALSSHIKSGDLLDALDVPVIEPVFKVR